MSSSHPPPLSVVLFWLGRAEGFGRGQLRAWCIIADTRYEDGSVYIGRHSDTAENRVIAAVSLGAERTLVFTPRLPPKPILTTLSSTEKRELEGRSSMKLRYVLILSCLIVTEADGRLGNGSLLVMRPPTQEYWKVRAERGSVS